MSRVRMPAVAGRFYASEPGALRRELQGYLDEVPASEAVTQRAFVVPHAGTVYSGPVAAHAYARLAALRDGVSGVLLLGPSHFVAFSGMAVPRADELRTPLGDVRVHEGLRARALDLEGVVADDRPHAEEHSLEVQLPFLQLVLPGVAVLPLLLGAVDPLLVEALVEELWDEEVVVLASTDLSHYESYVDCARLDEATARAVCELRPERIEDSDACGAAGLRALMRVARRRRLAVEVLDLRNSGDTAGPRSQVVGYGAFAIG
jgi:AmmeMemoRadiSam system protein B